MVMTTTTDASAVRRRIPGDVERTIRRTQRFDGVFSAGGVVVLVVAMGLLLTLLADLAADGLGRIDGDLLTSLPSRRPSQAAILSAWFGTSLTIGALTFIAFQPPAPVQSNPTVLEPRLAVLPVHGHADPDVQRYLATAGGVPRQCRRYRRDPDGDDDGDERRCDLDPIPAPPTDAIVSADMAASPLPHLRKATVTDPADAATGRSRLAETGTQATLRADVRELSFWYGEAQALKNISMPIVDRSVTALIGPSGCGKSTLLRCFNRMHDLYPGNRYQGSITVYPEGDNIIGPDADPILVRLRIGMVFQKPNPFPKSILENVAAGLHVRGLRKRSLIEETVEAALRKAALSDEVKDRLHRSAYDLSGGQQQRLCIARALAPEPEILLLDEPTSALDPIATAKIEDLIRQRGAEITIVIVTHNMQQASRISNPAGFMYLGKLVEHGDTRQMFVTLRDERTEAYITGRYG
jgi:phosphate transport system ATP-binding protein